MPSPPETADEDIARLRAKLRETEDMLVAAEELLLATGHSLEDIEQNKADGATAQSSVRSAAGPYRLLVEQISQPALTIMQDGSIIFCNTAFANLVGLPRERLVGTALAEILSGGPEKKSLVDELTRGAQRARQWSVRCPDGMKSVSLSCRSVRLFGKAVHSLVVSPNDLPAAHTLPKMDGHDRDHGRERAGQTRLQQTDGHE